MNMAGSGKNMRDKVRLKEAVEAVELMVRNGIHVSHKILYPLMRECTERKDIGSGRRMQHIMFRSGSESVTYVSDHFIRLSASCGNLLEANQAFEQVLNPSVYTWTAAISANSKLRESETALGMYGKMQIDSDRCTYLSALNACAIVAAYPQGRLVHNEIIQSGLVGDIVICNALVDMYAKSGSLEEAHIVFDKLASPDVTAWGTLMAGYAWNGDDFSSLKLYEEMQGKDIKPNKLMFLPLLKACSALKAIGQGRLINAEIIEARLQLDEKIGSALINMYAKCGNLEEATKIYQKLPHKDVVLFGTMISAYAQHGYGFQALEYFENMRLAGIKPNEVTFLCTLKACASVEVLERGRIIHSEVLENGFGFNPIIRSTLVDVYAKCGSLEEAHRIFDNLQSPDVVAWASIIMGYAEKKSVDIPLELFQEMQHLKIEADQVLLLNILKVCKNGGIVEKGRMIHELIFKCHLEHNVPIGNALIDMYSKCGSLQEASNVFNKLPKHDVVSWDVIIAGYANHSDNFVVLDLFKTMQQEGVKPDEVTFLTILKACGNAKALDHGRQIHDQMMKCGIELDGMIGNALLDMYAKCGNLEEACKIFSELSNKDVVSWGTMIAGYVRLGHEFSAYKLYQDMQQQDIKPNGTIFSSMLKACAGMGALDQGKSIHDEVIKHGLDLDVFITSALVDMYAKCGSLEDACKVFFGFPNHNPVPWTAMIAGYAQSGSIFLAANCLEDMQNKGFKPDYVTFISILAACSQACLVDEGRFYFRSMIEACGMAPSISQYNCMVDLFARAGCLNEAKALLQMVQSNCIGWMSLLTACQKYHNVDLGKQCFDQVIHLEPQNAAAFVLMSRIYVNAGMVEDARRLEEMRKSFGAWKKPAKAWIEVNNKVHEFIVGDKSHPQSAEIYAILKGLNKRMKEEGYRPRLSLVLKEMTEQDKEDALCGHCEKLAIAFGILNLPQGMGIRVTKNLCICDDCHSATKFISKLENREIIIRDAYRIHFFKDGTCSCGDYN